jgi:hypothetical protein
MSHDECSRDRREAEADGRPPGDGALAGVGGQRDEARERHDHE